MSKLVSTRVSASAAWPERPENDERHVWRVHALQAPHRFEAHVNSLREREIDRTYWLVGSTAVTAAESQRLSHGPTRDAIPVTHRFFRCLVAPSCRRDASRFMTRSRSSGFNFASSRAARRTLASPRSSPA